MWVVPTHSRVLGLVVSVYTRSGQWQTAYTGDGPLRRFPLHNPNSTLPQEIAKFTANSRSYRLQKTCLWSSWFVAVTVEPRARVKGIGSSFPGFAIPRVRVRAGHLTVTLKILGMANPNRVKTRITTTIKLATSPATLAQVLQPSLA